MSFSVHEFKVVREFNLGQVYRVCAHREEIKQPLKQREKKTMAVHLTTDGRQFGYVCVQQEMPMKKEEEAWLLGKNLPLS